MCTKPNQTTCFNVSEKNYFSNARGGGTCPHAH